jgi:phage recombination protein Bet
MAEKAVATQTGSGVDQKEVTYKAADGQEIRITPEMVRKFLVHGHGEMVTMQEMVYFLNICKSRKLNPFIKDCYLIKYSAGDPASVVTSVDYFRKRARSMPDCKGWKSGVIVLDADGKIKDTAGLVLEGETLVGGFFEAKPSGWDAPMRLEVNLRGYIKKTSQGNVTKFWSDENQPSQIAKVAESQGLRRAWPDEFQGLYTEEEISQEDRREAIDVNGGQDAKAEAPDVDKIWKKIEGSLPEGVSMADVAKFVLLNAEANKVTIADILVETEKDLKKFWKIYGAWKKQMDKRAENKKNGAAANIHNSPEEAPVIHPETDGPLVPELAPGECPERPGVQLFKKVCDECARRPGCPTWA